jgi:hypothetical protein
MSWRGLACCTTDQSLVAPSRASRHRPVCWFLMKNPSVPSGMQFQHHHGWSLYATKPIDSNVQFCSAEDRKQERCWTGTPAHSTCPLGSTGWKHLLLPMLMSGIAKFS